MKTAVIRARIPEELKQDFEAAASARGWNLSQGVRFLMKQYVIQEKELARRKKETFEALEDVSAGRIIEGEAVMDWLDSWGSGQEDAAGLLKKCGVPALEGVRKAVEALILELKKLKNNSILAD